MKKLLVLAAVVAALGISAPSHAESICADAGASNPTGIQLPSLGAPGGIVLPVICVPVP